MCGRYYIDSDMADEIEKVVHEIWFSIPFISNYPQR